MFKKTDSKKIFVIQIIEHINQISANDKNRVLFDDWIFSIERPQISGFIDEKDSNIKIPYQNITSFLFHGDELNIKINGALLTIKEQPFSFYHYILLAAYSFNEHDIFYKLLKERILNNTLIDYELYQTKLNRLYID